MMGRVRLHDGGRGCEQVVCSCKEWNCNGFMNGSSRDTEMIERSIFQTGNCCNERYTHVPVCLYICV